MRAIIEHLEPELSDWCLLEYAHISARYEGQVIFTNVHKEKDRETLRQLGRVDERPVKDLIAAGELKGVCLLDPKADKELSPDDDFAGVVLGGILGDHPMKGRTEKHFRGLDLPRRRMGGKQMSTDTAAVVARKILVGKIPFDKLEFQDGIEIKFEEGYSQVFPFRYLLEQGKLVLTPGLIELLQEQDQELN